MLWQYPGSQLPSGVKYFKYLITAEHCVSGSADIHLPFHSAIFTLPRDASLSSRKHCAKFTDLLTLEGTSGCHLGHPGLIVYKPLLTRLTIETPLCSWPQRGNTSPCELQSPGRAHDLCAQGFSTALPRPQGTGTAKPLPLFQGWGDSKSIKKQPTSQLTRETPRTWWIQVPKPSSHRQTATEPPENMPHQQMCHTSKCAGEARREGRLLLQSSKQKFLETKPKILSHQVFLKKTIQKQFSERPEETLTRGLPDSSAATVRHRPFTQALEELTC